MPSEPVTRLELEQLALGELSEDRARELEASAAEDSGLRARIDHVRAELDDAARDLPPLRLPSPVPRVARLLPAVAVGLALAAAAVVWLRPAEPHTLVRGAPFDLEVERLRNGRTESVAGVVEVREGDRIQYEITSAKAGTIGVFDVQDDGQLFVWLPPRQIAAWEPVVGAAELDDYSGSERIYFVFDPDGFTVEDVEYAVERAWDTPVPALDALPLDAAQRSVVLLREETP